MKQTAKIARDEDICARYLAGESQQSIAAIHSISPERVRQIVRAAGLQAGDFGRDAPKAVAS